MFDVPDKTTVNSTEYKPPKGAIGFAPELISFILEGKKLTTYRLGEKYDYMKIGDVVEVQNSSTKETVCKTTITGKSKPTFTELPLRISVHEAYKDKEHQRKVLSGYYAFLGRPISDDDKFIKFEFQLEPELE